MFAISIVYLKQKEAPIGLIDNLLASTYPNSLFSSYHPRYFAIVVKQISLILMSNFKKNLDDKKIYEHLSLSTYWSLGKGFISLLFFFFLFCLLIWKTTLIANQTNSLRNLLLTQFVYGKTKTYYVVYMKDPSLVLSPSFVIHRITDGSVHLLYTSMLLYHYVQFCLKQLMIVGSSYNKRLSPRLAELCLLLLASRRKVKALTFQ